MKFTFLFSQILFILLVSFSRVNAQDKLMLLNGKVLEGNFKSINDRSISFEVVKKKKRKVTEVEKDRIFSVTLPSGKEHVLYKQDSTLGYDFTVDEMRYFLLGEQDAQKGYRAPMSTIIGFGLGAGVPFAVGEYISLATPLVYTPLQLIPTIRIKKKSVSNPDYLKQETYIMGYVRVARNRRIQNAIKGSISGLAVGITSFLYVLPQLEK